jgi:hypothetical protein
MPVHRKISYYLFFFVIKTKIKIYQRAGIAHRRELIGNVALPLA